MSKGNSFINAAAAIGVVVASSLYIQRLQKAVKDRDLSKDNDLNLKEETSSADEQKFSVPKELKSCPYIAELELGIRLSLEAGANMLEHYETVGTENQSSISVMTKGSDIDFATEIDTKNEDLVISHIKSKFPKHMIIGEETSAADGNIPELTDKPTWIIDPVDGTTNFASGLPLTCVSIGLCVNKEPVMGVVFAPMTNELYIGVKDHGAYRNGVRIRGGYMNSKKTLEESIVCFEFGYSRSGDAVEKMTSAVTNILNHGCKSCKCLGSGVLDLCYVARGSIDVVYTGVVDEGWKPWDYCAATVICYEAGCAARTLYDEHDGGVFNIYSKSMVFGVNKAVVSECREVVLKSHFINLNVVGARLKF